MTKLFNIRLIPIILITLILAILLGAFLPSLYVAGISVILLIALLFIFNIDKLDKIKKLIFCLVIILILFSNFTSNIINKQNNSFDGSKIVEVKGRVTIDSPINIDGSLDISNNYDYAILDNVQVNGEKIRAKAKIKLDQNFLSMLKVGDFLIVNAYVSPTTITPTDSYQISDFCDNIKLNVLPIFNPEYKDFYFEVSNNKIKLSEKIRLKFVSNVDKATNKESAGFLYAMTFGDKQFMSESNKQNFAYCSQT